MIWIRIFIIAITALAITSCKSEEKKATSASQTSPEISGEKDGGNKKSKEKKSTRTVRPKSGTQIKVPKLILPQSGQSAQPSVSDSQNQISEIREKQINKQRENAKRCEFEKKSFKDLNGQYRLQFINSYDHDVSYLEGSLIANLEYLEISGSNQPEDKFKLLFKAYYTAPNSDSIILSIGEPLPDDSPFEVVEEQINQLKAHIKLKYKNQDRTLSYDFEYLPVDDWDIHKMKLEVFDTKVGHPEKVYYYTFNKNCFEDRWEEVKTLKPEALQFRYNESVFLGKAYLGRDSNHKTDQRFYRIDAGDTFQYLSHAELRGKEIASEFPSTREQADSFDLLDSTGLENVEVLNLKFVEGYRDRMTVINEDGERVEGLNPRFHLAPRKGRNSCVFLKKIDPNRSFCMGDRIAYYNITDKNQTQTTRSVKIGYIHYFWENFALVTDYHLGEITETLDAKEVKLISIDSIKGRSR